MQPARITVRKHQIDSRFIVEINSVGISTAYLPDQTAAEHFAAGLAMGLRMGGRSCEVVIDVPEADDGTDMLDMGALDACAQRFARPVEDDPEADPVERRLAREAEAGRFIAEAREL